MTATHAPASTPQGAASRAYDAFISYSRTADGKLGPALQRGLQRFAKPWYRLRALRVFRDDASLSANPDLWGSIEQALDGSRYFILLASPAAGQSPWVAKEAQYWIEHRGTEQVLVVLTEGELDWSADGHVDGAHTSALPAPLANALDEEPRYVDLRWARSDTQLAQRDARFRAAIADLAAPIHGRSKDDMLGEDVRQHKRTLAVAWTAAGLLAALAIAASAAAVLALQQRDRARTQSNIAVSGQLAAESAAQANASHALTPLLALESYRRVLGQSDARTYDARNALLSALQRSPPLLATLPATHLTDAVFSPDGNTLVTGDDSGRVQFWDARDGHPLGPARTGTGAPVWAMAFSPDDTTVAVGDNTGRVELWNAKTRRPEQKQIPKAARWIQVITFSSDGKRIAVIGADSAFGPPHVRVWRTAALGKPLELPRNADATQDVNDAVFTRDGSALLTTDRDSDVWLWTRHGTHQLPDVSGYLLATGRDGRILLLAKTRHGSRVVDALTRKPLGPKLGEDGAFFSALAPGGHAVASASPGSPLTLWHLGGPKAAAEDLQAGQGVYATPVFNADGTEFASVGQNGTVELWDTRSAAPLTVESLSPPHDKFMESASAVALAPNGDAAAGDSSGITFWDGAHSKPTRRSTTWGDEPLAFSSDGKLLAAASNGNLDVWNVTRRKLLFSVPAPRAHGTFGFGLTAAFSADDRELTATTSDGSSKTWDVSGSKPVQKRSTEAKTVTPPEPCHGIVGKGQQCAADPRSVAVAPDGTLVYSTSGNGVRFWDPKSGSPLGGLNTDAIEVALTPDGLTLATGGLGGMELWDVQRRQPLGETLTDPAGIGAIAFADGGTRLASGDDHGGVTVWDPLLLSTSFDAWRTRLCRLAGRNLTRAEWTQFLPGSRYGKTCPGLP